MPFSNRTTVYNIWFWALVDRHPCLLIYQHDYTQLSSSSSSSNVYNIWGPGPGSSSNILPALPSLFPLPTHHFYLTHLSAFFGIHMIGDHYLCVLQKSLSSVSSNFYGTSQPSPRPPRPRPRHRPVRIRYQCPPVFGITRKSRLFMFLYYSVR